MHFSSYRKKTDEFLKVLGKRATLWFGLSLVSALLLVIAEYGFAAAIQFLLVSLKLIPSTFLSSSFLIPNLSPLQVGALFCCVGIFRGACLIFVGASALVAEKLLEARLRQLALFEMLVDSRKKFTSATNANFLFMELFPKASSAVGTGVGLLSSTMVALGLLVCMFVTDFADASVALIGIAIICGSVLLVNKKIRTISEKQLSPSKGLLHGIQRVTRNLILIRILKTETKESGELTGLNVESTSHVIRAGIASTFGATIPPVLGIFLLGALIYFQTFTTHSSGMTFLSMLYLLARFVQVMGQAAISLGQVSQSWPHLRETLLYCRSRPDEDRHKAVFPIKYIRIFHSPRRARRDENEAHRLRRSAPKPRRLHSAPKIELSDVRFAYHKGSDTIGGLSLNIPAGEQFGIIGSSGTGKSTILGLILGILEPNSGKVHINGMTPSEYFAKYGDAVGYVGTEPFLISGTIKENLDYGQARIYTPEEYKDAITLASLQSALNRFKDGLNHPIREDGSGMSAGEKQRLSLARALLRRPTILILDEASANLDSVTEAQIARAIYEIKYRCTRLIVSHRMRMLKHTSLIFDLERRQMCHFADIVKLQSDVSGDVDTASPPLPFKKTSKRARSR